MFGKTVEHIRLVQEHGFGLTVIGPAFKFLIMFGKRTIKHHRGYSSVGRALAWHARGLGFKSPYLHYRDHDFAGNRGFLLVWSLESIGVGSLLDVKGTG